MLLKERICLVTGASKGIGRATAELFAAQGATVIAVGRNLDALESLVDGLPSEGRRHRFFKLDLTREEEVVSLFNELASEKTPIHCLVNNAGIMEVSTLNTVKPDMIERVYGANVFATIYATRQAIKSMVRNRGGSVINMSSIIGTKGFSGQSVYGSSKSAIVGFTTSLSKELAPLNIRVNAIAPGFIDTDMTRDMDPNAHVKILPSIGMRRAGTPEDVARVALFLASDLSTYVTGQVIGVDGGMII